MSKLKKLVVGLLAAISTMAAGQNNALDPTQVYTTGNLTNFNQGGSTTTTSWQNVGQWGGSLTCWAPGGPGYCGPNPYVNANGQGVINFSYGFTDLYQVVNIASALPNTGTGLRVNGFNFGFMAKNGNGWDNGQQDYLVAYVNFYDKSGKTAQSYNYGTQTNQLYNWTQFNFSETFATPYASKDLSTARYGFVGYDTNYWAGPYGPEIYNVNFSLKYSVDPCATNVLYSPTCPGYMDALAKLTPASTATATTNTQSTNTIIEPLPPSTVTSVSTATVSSTTPTTSPTTSTAVSTNTAAVSSTSLTVSPGAAARSDGVGIGLSLIAKNQQREQAIAMQAAQTAIAATEQLAQQTQKDAVALAQTQSANSVMTQSLPTSGPVSMSGYASSMQLVQQQQQRETSVQAQYTMAAPTAPSGGARDISSGSPMQYRSDTPTATVTAATQTSAFSLLPPPPPPQINTAARAVDTITAAAASQQPSSTVAQIVPTQTPTISAQPVVVSYELVPPVSAQPTVTAVAATTQTNFAVLYTPPQSGSLSVAETLPMDSSRMFTDRTNPIGQILENRQIEFAAGPTANTVSTVNPRAADNDAAAGGPNIGSMATVPAGYAAYTNIVLRDVAFYEPKEVYRNQRTVDNARALRSLTNDARHRAMVEMQYAR